MNAGVSVASLHRHAGHQIEVYHRSGSAYITVIDCLTCQERLGAEYVGRDDGLRLDCAEPAHFPGQALAALPGWVGPERLVRCPGGGLASSDALGRITGDVHDALWSACPRCLVDVPVMRLNGKGGPLMRILHNVLPGAVVPEGSTGEEVCECVHIRREHKGGAWCALCPNGVCRRFRLAA